MTLSLFQIIFAISILCNFLISCIQVGDVTLISVKYLPIISIPTKKSCSSIKRSLISLQIFKVLLR